MLNISKLKFIEHLNISGNYLSYCLFIQNIFSRPYVKYKSIRYKCK